MFPEKEWAAARPPVSTPPLLAGLARLTLLFGSLALAVSYFIAPSPQGWHALDGVDAMTTSYIGQQGTEILRRDGLGRSPESLCIIRDNDTRAGSC